MRPAPSPAWLSPPCELGKAMVGMPRECDPNAPIVGGAPVVVRGRESRSHGEGEQVSRRDCARRNRRWTPTIRAIGSGFSTFSAGKALGLDGCFTLGRHDDFDRFHQVAPPTLMVSFSEPSASCCSVHVCPARRLSIFAFSTAYIWRYLSSWARSPQRSW